MTDKIIPIKRTITENKHQLFYDECGQFIGESYEYDDGYYQEFGNYTPDVEINHVGYSLGKLLCDKCEEKAERELLQAIKQLCYKREDDY